MKRDVTIGELMEQASRFERMDALQGETVRIVKGLTKALAETRQELRKLDKKVDGIDTALGGQHERLEAVEVYAERCLCPNKENSCSREEEAPANLGEVVACISVGTSSLFENFKRMVTRLNDALNPSLTTILEGPRWRTAAGAWMFPSEMDDEHLLNTIRYIYTHAPNTKVDDMLADFHLFDIPFSELHPNTQHVIRHELKNHNKKFRREWLQEKPLYREMLVEAFHRGLLTGSTEFGKIVFPYRK